MTVTLLCGRKDRLSHVAEPSRCEYTAELETPAACTPDTVDALKVGALWEDPAPVPLLARVPALWRSVSRRCSAQLLLLLLPSLSQAELRARQQQLEGNTGGDEAAAAGPRDEL